MGGHQHLPLLPSLSNVSKAEKASKWGQTCLHLHVLFWAVGNKTRGTTRGAECTAVLSLVKKNWEEERALAQCCSAERVLAAFP